MKLDGQEIEEQKIEAVQTAYEYIERLKKGISEAICYFREDQLGEGYNLTSQITMGLDWLISIINLTKDIQVDIVDLKAFNNIGNELTEAIRVEDTVLIADLLQYEIMEFVQQWQANLKNTYHKYMG